MVISPWSIRHAKVAEAVSPILIRAALPVTASMTADVSSCQWRNHSWENSRCRT